MRRITAILVALALGCVAVADAQDAHCPQLDPSAPLLTRYDELVAGARRTLVVRYDATRRTWTPATQLRMPLHHASNIDFDGHAFPTDAHDGDTLSLVVVAVSRTLVRFEADIRTWFFSYKVRVASSAACSR